MILRVETLFLKVLVLTDMPLTSSDITHLKHEITGIETY